MPLKNNYLTAYDFINDIDPHIDKDILQIGAEFKKLPVKERKWDYLLAYLKHNNMIPEEELGLTSDAYRMRVNRFIRESEDYLEQFNFNRSIKENKIVSDKEEEVKKFREFYSEKQQIRDWYNAYRRDIRNEARIENLKDEIKNAANKFSKLPINIKPNKYDCRDVEAIALISDWHIGQIADNFYNKYDEKIAEERVSKLASNIVHYCTLNKVKTLHILNLGDLIEGLINTNARIEQQLDVAEQLMIAGELLANFLLYLNNNVNHVTYRSVTDNHSRLISDKHQHIEKENLYRIIDWFIKERLKDSSIEFIDDNIDRGFGLFTLDNGMKVAFMHGHEDAKCKTLQNVVGATREWVDIVCCGHYHNASEHTFQDMKLYVNGSLCGTGPYALKNRLFAKPNQKLLLVDNNIIDININI